MFQRGNDNDFIQGLARDGGFDISSGDTTDGDTLSVSLTAGANFADGDGNVTGYLVYRSSDPVNGSIIDSAGCQLVLNDDGTPAWGGSATEVSGTGGPNSYPTYDILGRQLFVGFTQRF